MDCIPIGRKIITVSIQLHGNIIDLNLSPEIHNVFRNTRLFSYAGTYASAYYSYGDARSRMKQMQQTFARDIEGESMVDEFNRYITPIAEKYREELTRTNKLDTAEKVQNVCKHIGAITVDKAFAKSDRNFIEHCISYVLPEIEDIYVVSVHEKIGENHYTLLSHPEDVYRGLCNLSFFREKGRDDIANMLIAESTLLPDFHSAKKQIDAIESNAALTDAEKEMRIQAIKDPIYGAVKEWKCTTQNDMLRSIRMSMLTRVLKMLYGEDCYIQYIDYTCNDVSMFVPREQYAYKPYYRETDIEQGISGIKGGKTKRKRQNRKKYGKKRILRKTRKQNRR